MQEMLARMRAAARSWLASPPPGSGALVRQLDAAGLRTWIRVPDRAALLAAPELTTIGFFGQPRDDVDHAPIHELETAIVETLEEVPASSATSTSSWHRDASVTSSSARRRTSPCAGAHMTCIAWRSRWRRATTTGP